MEMSISVLGKLSFDLKSVEATRHVCIEIHVNTDDAANRVVNEKKKRKIGTELRVARLHGTVREERTAGVASVAGYVESAH